MIVIFGIRTLLCTINTKVFMIYSNWSFICISIRIHKLDQNIDDRNKHHTLSEKIFELIQCLVIFDKYTTCDWQATSFFYAFYANEI